MPELFLPVVKSVSVSENITAWLEDGIREIAKQQSNMKINKKDILRKEYDKTYKKLNNLYDLQLESRINKDMFHIKEKKLSEKLAELKSELATCDVNTQEVCNKANKTLEIVNIQTSK